MSFYGYESAPKEIRELYDKLLNCWSRETCAVGMRPDWSRENPTLGQCSITSFIVQDLFGGEVLGIPLPGGGTHCFNELNGVRFDLTSEQFGGKVLVYDEKHPQSREKHFASEEKYERYLYIKKELKAYLEKLGK